MKKYDSYKDSGIEYLDKIPVHWQELRMRFIGYLYGGLSGKSANDFNQLTNEDNKCFIPFTNIANNFRIDPESLQTVVIAENEKQNKVKKGDLFFLMSSENYDDVGKSAVLLDDLEETYLNSFCKGFRITKENIVPKFLNYQLHSKQLRHNLLTGANGFTRINLKIDKVIDLLTALPPIAEQTSIASFLDRKTSEIDDIIADKKRLLELYEEEKTAIINQAVTKGLDPNAPMKDSGIEWLGEIPEHWEVKKLKNISSIVLGKMLLSQDKGGYSLKPYLRAANLNWINVNVEDVKEMWFSDMEILKYRLKRNDLLVSEGGEVGRTCIWKEELDECYIQNSVHKVTFHDSYEPHYYLQLFFVYGKIGAFDSLVNRISIAHLTAEKLREVEILDLPLKEQQLIVHHIESECSKIDFKKARTEELIELLTEYRTSLISEAVTGKIKVTED